MTTTNSMIRLATPLIIAAQLACGITGPAATSSGSGGGAAGSGGTGGAESITECNNGVVEVGEVCLFGPIAAVPTNVGDGKALELVDCDSDGDLDALVLGLAPGNEATLVVMRNDGDGTFGVAIPTVIGSYEPLDMAFSTASNYRESIPVIGTNAFSIVTIGDDCELTVTKTIPIQGVIQRGVATLNLDGDATIDFLLTMNVGADSYLVWHKSSTDNFGQAGPFPSLNGVGSATVGRDDDGVFAAFGNSSTGKIRLYAAGSQEPVGVGEAPNTGSVGYGHSDLISVDVDGDGNMELVTANTLANTVTVLVKSQGFIRIGPDVSIVGHGNLVGHAPTRIAAGDVDADGDVDLLTANAGKSGTASSLTVLLNDGAGLFSIAPAPPNQEDLLSYLGHPFPYHWTPALKVADLNGDGALDVVGLNNYISSLTILLAEP